MGCLGIAVVLSCVYVCSSSVEVRTKHGVVRGKTERSCHGVDYFAFLGVPYAQPPVDHLRFKDPQPLGFNSNSVVDATSEAPECLQQHFMLNYSLVGSEDCLYLNIFTTSLERNGDLMPVMVWIHGGAFMWGSCSIEVYGPDYFIDHPVVLVTIQYRLGAIGFLNSSNLGLKDQTMALRWIKDNIDAFGGNPQSVTIFGESAGGSSVHFHMMSPMSRGLFHRAISQSGTALCTWGYVEPEQVVIRTKQLAAFLNCPDDTLQEMVECIQSRNGEEIVQQHVKFLEFGIDPEVPFGPSVDSYGNDRFLPDEPYNMLESSDIEPVPWLVGMTESEGAYSSAVVMGDFNLLNRLRLDHINIFPITLDYKHLMHHQQLTSKIYKYYFGNAEVGEETVMNLTALYSDRHYFYGIYDSLRLHALADIAPVFWYRLSHRREKYSISAVMGDKDRDYGACHADDLQYLFSGNAFPAFEEGEFERHLSATMIRLWVNFATYGNPTPTDADLSDVLWKPVRPHEMEYMDIGQNLEMKSSFPYERMAFWSSLPLHDNGYRHCNAIRDEL